MGLGIPKPTDLSTAAAGAIPDWDNMSFPSVGNYYTEPTSGLRVWRITGPGTPHVSESHVHYYSQWMLISRSYGDDDDKFHLLIHSEPSNSTYLVDFQYGVGPSNYRSFTGAADALCSFSRTNPHDLIYVNSSGVIHKYDCLNNQNNDTGNYPKNLKADSNVTSVLGTGWSPVRANLQGDDSAFLMHTDTGGIIAWRPSNDTVVVKAGSFGRMNSIESETDYAFPGYIRWRLSTNTTTNMPGSHSHLDWGLRYGWSRDPNSRVWYRYDTPNNSLTATGLNGTNFTMNTVHVSAKWTTQNESTGQWCCVSGYVDDVQGDTAHDVTLANSWVQHDNYIYKCSNWTTYWSRSADVNAVLQGTWASGNVPWGTGDWLTEVGSVGAMTEGTFFWDSGTCYVWLNGNITPTSGGFGRNVTCFDLQPGSSSIVLSKMDGSDVRFVAHHWTHDRSSGQAGGYWEQPHANISPDGRLIMWTSNMNSASRSDVFLAEMPLSSPIYKDLTLQWDMSEFVSKDLQLTWSILSEVTQVNKDLALQWDINELVNKDLVAQWDMREFVNKDLALLWSILGYAQVNKDLVAQWDIRNLAGKILTLKWHLNWTAGGGKDRDSVMDLTRRDTIA